MTVRTEKIQALTGSAPLTLPTQLPSSTRNVQVSTSGVLSTPSVANSLNNLTNAGNSGYVLLDHQEWSENQSTVHLKMDGTDYTASDIYAFEIWMDAVLIYNSSRGTVREYFISPMNGNTSISLGISSSYYAGDAKMFGYTSQWMAGNGGANRNGSNQAFDAAGNNIGYEWADQQTAIGSDWTGGNYAQNYTSDFYTGGQMYGGQAAGFYGKLRYYNGFCGRGFDPDLCGMQLYTENSTGSGMYQSYSIYGASTTSQGSYPSNMQNAADGFLLCSNNSNNSFQGNFMLFGIPKATT